jgi:hypothetical protein
LSRVLSKFYLFILFFIVDDIWANKAYQLQQSVSRGFFPTFNHLLLALPVSSSSSSRVIIVVVVIIIITTTTTHTTTTTTTAAAATATTHTTTTTTTTL